MILDLMRSIETFWKGSTALASTSLYWGVPARATAFPYVIVNQVFGGDVGYDTGPEHLEDYMVSFEGYVKTSTTTSGDQAAYTLAGDIRDRFDFCNTRGFSVPGANAFDVLRENPIFVASVEAEENDPDFRDIWVCQLMYRFRVQETYGVSRA